MIEEYLRLGCTKKSLLLKYDIRMKSGISTWMRQLGYVDIPIKNATLKIPIIHSLASKNNISKRSQSTEDLEKRIKELERLLEDEQLRSEGYSRMIDYAERELNIPIRKKSDTK